ncbi:hypothetical protein BTH42_33045 [Burkholderia sp. SRS-W-2-2016]|uniref:hypothetical protein n=1 Tax=Burkholderia sp. SRS-W-2-2016 TaxID=1926878 RepID=UPI00094B2BB0|nr:hypothetical protein [Burkholderia sp. SRS-W-2-2016]OLL27429.1 hypothetical protein BTH42_33045 [Burkholderia sp. SRS-W-2-2016]
MDLILALRIVAVVLTVACLSIATLMVQHDLLSVTSTTPIEVLPRARWPAILTRAGMMCMLASFVLILWICFLLTD